MPDEDFDPKEAPTAPDRAARCMACDGSGSRLVDISEEPETRVRMVARICPVCSGRKRLSREELARYVAGVKRDVNLRTRCGEAIWRARVALRQPARSARTL